MFSLIGPNVVTETNYRRQRTKPEGEEPNPAKRVVSTLIPVEVISDPVAATAEEVFYGAYEAGFYGHDLTILDIGANVGAFALWANLRWPNSRILCFEPHPGTFQTLIENVRHLPNVSCFNSAVYTRRTPLYARYSGDGEASLLEHAQRLFARTDPENVLEVNTAHPSELDRADIVKVDTEGSEVEILKNLDLEETSLVVLEYHTSRDRDEVLRTLSSFSLEHEQKIPWSRIPNLERYRPELAGDFCGVLVLYKNGSTRVWKNRMPSPPPAGLRSLMRQLPGALKTSLLSRLRR